MALYAKKSWKAPTESSSSGNTNDATKKSAPSEDESNDKGLAYTVELPKAAGISWSSDISFRWIYVQDIDPNSPAADNGSIQKVIIIVEDCLI